MRDLRLFSSITVFLLCGAIYFAAASLAQAQVVPSARGLGQSIWVGGQYSNIEAGFPYNSGQRLQGVGVVGTFNWNHRYGLEANADFFDFGSFHGEHEHSLMAGPRYTFLHSYKWRPFAVFQVGVTSMKFPFDIGTYDYLSLAPAGGVEYRLGPSWIARAEYRYQFLLNSPHFTNEPQFGIQPNGIQVGISYRLRGWLFPH